MIITGTAAARSGLTLLARLVGANNLPLTQASLASIAYAVQDLTAAAAIASGALTIANVIYDALQTDPVWTKDSDTLPGPDGLTGYNFRWTVPAANLQTGGHVYQVDVKFTPTSGEAFVQTWKITLNTVYTT